MAGDIVSSDMAWDRVEGPPDFAARRLTAKDQIWRLLSQCTDKRRQSATDVADYVDPETAVIVQPTGPGPAVVSVDGCVDAAVGSAGLGNGLQHDGQIANVGGYASRLLTACIELASTVADPRSSPVISPVFVGTEMI